MDVCDYLSILGSFRCFGTVMELIQFAVEVIHLADHMEFSTEEGPYVFIHLIRLTNYF